MRTKGAKGKFPTKNFILLEAFKLFASKQYDQVTFDDLENATQLSRGAILYHVKNKDALFTEVVENFVLNRISITQVYEDGISLELLLSRFIQFCREEKKKNKQNGISNINMAILNIESSAYSFYEDMKKKSQEWHKNEQEAWVKAMKNAVKSGEIRKDVDVELLSKLFEHIYFGVSYTGIIEPRGFSPDILKKEFSFIYKSIKKV